MADSGKPTRRSRSTPPTVKKPMKWTRDLERRIIIAWRRMSAENRQKWRKLLFGNMSTEQMAEMALVLGRRHPLD